MYSQNGFRPGRSMTTHILEKINWRIERKQFIINNHIHKFQKGF